MSVPTGKDELIGLLKAHDWMYEYSDDHRAWRKGSGERSSIVEMLNHLPADEADKLWREYAPTTMQDDYANGLRKDI